MTRFGRVSRRVRWLALGLAVCGGVVGFWEPARAAEDRVQYASAAEVFDLGTPTLSDQELGQQRGAGLEAEGIVSLEDGDDLAVILWDEWQRIGNGGTSVASYDNGFDSQVSSSITGQAY